jgi:hypothetical protein
MIEKCFWCGEDKGLILFGRLPNDAEAPRSGAINHEPCEKCAEYMKMGVILISVDEKKSTDMKNPYRSGGWVVIKDEWVLKAVTTPELQQSILKARVAFIPDDAWDKLGLPRAADEVAT